MCAAMSRTLSAYGRAARMRSWARRIFDAATISIAFVILRVFCTLLILPRISFIPAIACSFVGPSYRFSGYSGPMQSFGPSQRFSVTRVPCKAIEAARGHSHAARAASRSVYALRVTRGSISAGLLEVFDGRMQQAFIVLREFLGVFDALDQVSVLRLQVITQALFERQHLRDFQIVEVTVVRSEQRDSQFPHLQRLILRLLEQFWYAAAGLHLLAGGFVEVRRELRERSQLTILRQVGTDTARQLLHDLRLSRTAHTRHRHAGVNCRADTCVEEVGFQEDLAVGNRDHFRRNEGGNV